MLCSLLQHLVSRVVILLCSSLFKVDVSHAYRNIDCSSDRISRILYFTAIDFSSQMMFNVGRAVIVYAIRL